MHRSGDVVERNAQTIIHLDEANRARSDASQYQLGKLRDLARQPRNLSACGLLVNNALARCAHQLRLRCLECVERGLLPFSHWNVLILAPPLTISTQELSEGLAILDEVLALADGYCRA